MFDADHFKSINDRFGHGVGDKVLIGMVDVMKQVCRDRHLIGRYGGEEFCVAVLGPEEEAGALAEAIRLAVQASSWLPEDERVTVSIGLAYASWVSKDIQDLVKRADEALYAAKKGGRNRVVNWRFLPAAQALLAS
jgi:diguanylate cyclase (GGDEF)-like protein